MFRWRSVKPSNDDHRSAAADSLYAEGVAALDREDLDAGRRALLESLQSDAVSLERVLDVAEKIASVGFIAEAEQMCAERSRSSLIAQPRSAMSIFCCKPK